MDGEQHEGGTGRHLIVQVGSDITYTRYYADESGESHIEDVEVELTPRDFAPPAPAAAPLSDDAGYRRCLRPLPGRLGRRLAPDAATELFFFLEGALEGETSDGERRRYGPGSAVLLEDTTGTGHRARVVGDGEVLAAVVQLAD